MTRIRSVLRFALPLALLLGAAVAAPANAEDTAQTKIPDESVMRVYQRGDKFIVAIYRQDGSAALALVEPPKSSPRSSGKGAPKPDMANLMQNGRVIYTVNIAAKDTPAAESTELSVSKSGKGIASTKLTRKQRSDLARQHKSAAGMLDTIGKGLINGTQIGGATLDPNTT